ncbi:pyridoxal phosphate-dependent class II aminotransferase [Vibrio tapetis subsp. quintayensis]|uniref:threonine-phosphate decarboxylase n=1 Tax=Vibrio tapetis TaxID=52443 RepID=UPI0025B4C8C4|nr:threonine-phosphate decarboxylase [Vibrio tapetis]MDN3683117.1 pyridoxal phosphate-dependent class II aminotransferase [Vibrio tapetis subsp. quintayensis]
MLNHGGKLRQYARQFDRPLNEWVDLSTGVSPFTYPIGSIPEPVWNRLPEDEDGLIEAACGYYQCDKLLPVAGSQAAIQLLPKLMLNRYLTLPNIAQHDVPIFRVGLPKVGYKEHQLAWRNAVFTYKQCGVLLEYCFYDAEPTHADLVQLDALLVINPNNPSTDKFTSEQLLTWRGLMKSDAVLLVDEAFMDMTPEQSILHHFASNSGTKSLPENIVVLRSLGKFFGLAGLRVGFLFAYPLILERAKSQIGPWAVTGPSRYAATKALADHAWQQQNRSRLRKEGERMQALLANHFSQQPNGHSLFYTVKLDNAEDVHIALAEQGILSRLCDEKDAVRFGLPKTEQEWLSFEQALNRIKEVR